MASQGKKVKILSKFEQQKSIKGVQKPKRNVVKNTLESPFALDWPAISTECEGKIKSLLQKTCSGLKKLKCKPPWKEVKKLKGADRTAFLKEYRQNFQESLDPVVVNQNRENEELLSHLIFGYNAVMRALEKDCLAGVLVKKNVEPTFLVKAFLPGCANKCIPLVPLDDLDNLLKDEETLALPHACMVLGLKPTVKDEGNRFYALFAEMCEAVDIEEGVDEGFEEEMECSTEITVTEDNKENKTCASNQSLTHEQVQSYYLKRTCKNKRAFIPGEGKGQNVDAMGCGSGFISLEPTKMDVFVQEEKMQLDSKPAKISKLKSKHKKKGAASNSLKSMGINSIFIDVWGDQDQPCQKDDVKQESSSFDARNVSKMENCQDKKRRKPKPHIFPYVSAKTKRVKNNPNRKDNKSGKIKKK